jgi:TolA-binding protein
MSIQSSFPTVADQVITSNKNIVEILSKINSLVTTEDNNVNIRIYDENGTLRTFSVPSFNSLKGEIDRLNHNINSLYSIDADGALIETSNRNKFKKIITVDLNREPNSISSLGSISKFKAVNNWFFDSLLNPMISVEIDLTGKVENNVRKILSRRYMVEFASDVEGNLTPLGQSALNSFNTLFRGKTNILITDFENWHSTTPGVISPSNPQFDEQVFDLDPHDLLYDGQFSVIRINEDRLNKKLWYVLDTLEYLVKGTNDIENLSIGSELIINSEKTSTRYKVIEVSTIESNPRVRLERVEGMEPIPVGIGVLKIYSPVVYNKKVKISIGYNEYNVVFVKALNSDNNILSKDWSLGTGFWTNDLTLESNSAENGLSMEEFYIDYVYDYGTVLHDLVAKKTPNSLAGTPESPTLNTDNFKVVQINKHLTESLDLKKIKQKHNYQVTLKSEIQQLQDAIISKNTKAKFVKFKSESEKKQINLELEELSRKKDSKSKLLSTTTNEILTLSNNPNTKVAPKFRLRGFWEMPLPVIKKGTKPQEVVQFKVQYRYLSKSGSQTPIETFKVGESNRDGSFSNWTEFKTDARKRTYNQATGEYFWEIQDVEDADTPNINQLDLSIQSNEMIEIRVKSISEVGWPESPEESEWSEPITIEFPDDLNNVLNESEFILKEATAEEMRIKMTQELSAKGLDDHLSDTVVVNNITYHHDSDKILSGFRDENGVALDLFTYLKSLQDRILSLEEKIKRTKGELEIVIMRNNQEFEVSNGSETSFNIECEDYLEKYTGNNSNIPTGRVYSNDIYVIKDFVIRVRNKATTPLGLLSNRNYTKSDLYNDNVPQVFWVNEHDELLTADTTGATKTHLNNQFIWMVNYDSVLESNVTKLSENIGNSFVNDNSNSVTNILSSNEYNIGYNENSILSFMGNNKSLLDSSKWIDDSISISSTTKLLTTIHPIVPNIESITENNSDKVYTIEDNKEKNDIIIPINIYFKMNSLDTNQSGLNYEYINLNASRKTTTHIKKVKFFLENESDNRPFTFSIKFKINRNKVILIKALTHNLNTGFNLNIK